MTKLVLVSFVLAAAACSTQPGASTQAVLSADPTARSFGIASYTVEGDTVRVLDSYGLELGSLTLREPAADRRTIDVALADGTTDEMEIYQPMSDGRFVAPITRDFVAGAALADATLAPFLAEHGVTLRTDREGVRTAALDPSIVATTTSCTTSSSDTPDGCARPANGAAGCTNPAQLPAAITADYNTSSTLGGWYSSLSHCQGTAPYDCSVQFGGTSSDWYTSVTCTYISLNTYTGTCNYRLTRNEWDASCPRSSCGTVGQYDSVPRIRQCYQPGSCIKYQGTVGCTPYH